MMVQPVAAFDAWNWQDSGYKLMTFNSSGLKRIGTLSGLNFEFVPATNMMQMQMYPYIHGRDDIRSTYEHSVYSNPVSLGVIRPSDATSFSAAPAESGDWSYDEFAQSYGVGEEFKLLASRIVPASLITTNAPGVRLFDGTKRTMVQPTQSWGSATLQDFIGNPAYFAVPTSSSVSVRTPSNNTVDLTGLQENWVLMWFGADSYLWSSTYPLFPNRGFASWYPGAYMYDPSHWIFKVDIPVLVVFDTKPQSLIVDPAGGIELNYGNSASKQIAFMPLLGQKYPFVSASDAENGSDPKQTTELWSTSLPSEITQLSREWYNRLGKFPESVSETYTFDTNNNQLSVTDTFSYRDLGFGQHYAPIAPVVTLAKNGGMPIQFVGNPQLNTSVTTLRIGPVAGIDNRTSYEYVVSGLDTYTAQNRIFINTGSEPSWVITKLQQEVSTVEQAGHLAPWWPYLGKFNPLFPDRAIWSFPWETQYYLSNTRDVLSNAAATNLDSYLQSEEQAYDMVTYGRKVSYVNNVQTVPYNTGTRRETSFIDTAMTPDDIGYSYHRMSVKPLMNLYALAGFYTNTGDTADLGTSGSYTQQWTQIKDIAKPYMLVSDWATMTFAPYDRNLGDDIRWGTLTSNEAVAGSIGLARLGTLVGDAESEQVGYYLLAKSLISRLAQEKITKHLYATAQLRNPTPADWMVQTSRNYGENGDAQLWQRNWTSYLSDIRKPIRFDQFGVVLKDQHSEGFRDRRLLAYANITPELGRFLAQYALPEVTEWVRINEENNGTWFEAYSDSYLGKENSYNIPDNAYEIFMVKAWVLGETADQLAKYLDVPWVPLGDYYYINKLAETIRAYRGTCWSADGTTCDDGSIPSITGDLNGDLTVNIQDIIILINEIFTPRGVEGSDINNDGKVDILDVIALINIIFT